MSPEKYWPRLLAGLVLKDVSSILLSDQLLSILSKVIQNKFSSTEQLPGFGGPSVRPGQKLAQ